MSDWLQELLHAPPVPAEPREDRPDVTASDVAAYMFCGRAWWFRRQGGPAAAALPALADGRRRHALAGAAIREWTEQVGRVLWWAVIGAIVCGLVALGISLGMGGW